jgi:hypothetical protein
MAVMQWDTSIDFVTVHEHGGWWMSYNRDGVVVGTANDRAVLPAATHEWAMQFDDSMLVGETRRCDNGEYTDTTFDAYWTLRQYNDPQVA